MAISKVVIAVLLLAMLACAAAQGPEPTGEAGRELKWLGKFKNHNGHNGYHKSYSKGYSKGYHKSYSKGKKLDWYDDYKDYKYKGKSYRYVKKKNYNYYFEDWCKLNKRHCYDHSHKEYKCFGNSKYIKFIYYIC